MSWFSDLFGREQEKEITDGAMELHWAEEQQQYRDRVAADSCPAGCS